MLAECAARFDWVLIDTPPVGVLPDAQVLARLVGEVILVIGAGSTPAAAIERAVAELGGPDAISGTVLESRRRAPHTGCRLLRPVRSIARTSLTSATCTRV